MAGLQSYFRMTGKSLASVIGPDSVRAGLEKYKGLLARHDQLAFITGPLSKAESKELEKLAKQKTEILKLTRLHKDAEVALTKEMKAQAQALSSGRAMAWSPAISQSHMGIMGRFMARIRAQGGIDPLLGTAAGYMGGGRMGGLGGAVGGMIGMAGWGAAIGAAVGMITAGFKRLFEAIRQGLTSLFDHARSLQQQKLQTGIGYGVGALLARMGEMGGQDMEAVGVMISRFQANLSAVEKTAPKVSNALTMLGLNLMQLRQMKADEALNAVLSALEKIPNWADQAGIMVALFNRHGASLMRILFNMKIAQEQLGEQKGIFDATAWKNAAGQAVKYGDVWAFIGNSIDSAKVKAQGFFVGLGKEWAEPLARMAQDFNRMDFAKLGMQFGNAFKPLISDLAAIMHSLAGILNMTNGLIAAMDEWKKKHPYLAKAAEIYGVGIRGTTFSMASRIDPTGTLQHLGTASRLFNFADELRKTDPTKGWSERIKNAWKTAFPIVPVAPDKLGAGGLGPLSSFFAPFGKGPGDQWSKIGAFTAPGMREGFATGIQGWRDKVVDKLTQIAQNTGGFRHGGNGSLIPFVWTQ